MAIGKRREQWDMNAMLRATIMTFNAMSKPNRNIDIEQLNPIRNAEKNG